jgi:hypothetical protein
METGLRAQQHEEAEQVSGGNGGQRYQLASL